MAAAFPFNFTFSSLESETFTPIPIWLMTGEAVLILVSMVGNSWIIYNGLSKKTLRDSSFHLLLTNLSLANLLLSSFCYTSFTFKLRIGLSRNEVEVEHCRVASICLTWFLGVALFSNCSLAVNRAMSCHPMLPLSVKFRSKRTTIILVASTWVLSLKIYLYPAIILRESWLYMFSCVTVDYIIENLFNDEELFKLEPAQSVTSWMIVCHLIFVLVVNVTSYAIILKYLFKQHGQGNSTSEQRKKEIKRALMVIVIIFVVLLVCWVPFLVALTIDPTLVAKNDIYLFLPAMEAAIDPVLYMVTMPVFRPGWLSKACQRLKGRKTKVTAVSSLGTQSTRVQGKGHDATASTLG